MDIPVYLFTGFLEAGKTKFIKETLADPNFNDPSRKYLIIQCEEGEEELEPGELTPNVSVCSFDREDDLVADRLIARQKRADADVIIIEYNGMWTLDKLYSALPEEFMVYQEIFIADSTTILSYNANMRQLVVDKLTSCEMVVFNRTDSTTDKMPLHKLVRGINRKSSICYETVDGDIEFDDIVDPLPFDVNAPVIEIKDEDYALFYRDMTEEPKKYDGKTVRFKAQVAMLRREKDGMFAPGRFVMTCCVEDIEFCGIPCRFAGAKMLESRSWVMVTAKIHAEKHRLYKGDIGPVLTAIEVVQGAAPAEPDVCTF